DSTFSPDVPLPIILSCSSSSVAIPDFIGHKIPAKYFCRGLTLISSCWLSGPISSYRRRSKSSPLTFFSEDMLITPSYILILCYQIPSINSHLFLLVLNYSFFQRMI